MKLIGKIKSDLGGNQIRDTHFGGASRAFSYFGYENMHSRILRTSLSFFLVCI